MYLVFGFLKMCKDGLEGDILIVFIFVLGGN